jgi:hypothetical protein
MSRRTVRLAALAGAAAVALGIASPVAAAAMERTATVHSVASTATPIRHAGRTVTVAMPTTHYTATADHSNTVVDLAVAGPTTVPAIDTNVTPANVTPASAASTGTIGVGTVAMFGFGGALVFGLKRKELSKGWTFIAVGFGVSSSATMVGVLYGQIVGSSISLIGNF